MGPRGICFSSELADRANERDNGIGGVPEMVGLEVPDVYSAELSGFVLAAGVKIMAERRPDLMYLSTTDYIQHKHAPGTPVANDFYALLDGYLGRLDAMDCTIVATADHGMNAKFDEAGAPRVIYLQSLFDDWLGAGAARVILPITDPYVVHHGALGSYATAYLPDGADAAALSERLAAIPGMLLVLDRNAAAERFELPPDRLGDLVLVSTHDHVLGTTAGRHDLSALKEPLRSHGGISEQRVPLLMNRPTDLAEGHALRNFDAFDLALNHAILT
jgi:phosphonoacetate hydrolase